MSVPGERREGNGLARRSKEETVLERSHILPQERSRRVSCRGGEKSVGGRRQELRWI